MLKLWGFPVWSDFLTTGEFVLSVVLRMLFLPMHNSACLLDEGPFYMPPTWLLRMCLNPLATSTIRYTSELQTFRYPSKK